VTQNTPAEYFQTPVIELGVDRRAAFITRTYVHLFAAILAFAGIEIYLFSSGLAERLAATMLSVSWLWILGGFMVVGWLASLVMKTGAQMGIIANVVVGIIGSGLGHWLAPMLSIEGGSIMQWIISIGGAVLLILILKVLGVFK